MSWALSLVFYGPYQFVVAIYSLVRCFRNKKFRETFLDRLTIRAGDAKDDVNPIWIHCASIGELRGIAPFVNLILDKNPDLNLIFTTTSSTGLVECRKLYPQMFSSILPLDMSFLMANFIKKNRPKLVLINETEIWPQLFIQAEKLNVPVLLVNGRISDRTFPNYLKWKFLFSFLLAKVDFFCVQTELDRERFISIGGDENKIGIFGNTKFDTNIASVGGEIDEMLRNFRVGTEVSISFGSVREEEEDIVLTAIAKIFHVDKTFTIFVSPRHPGRFKIFYDKLLKLGVPIVQRSKVQLSEMKSMSGNRIFYLDTMGEMLAIYKNSDLAFVGGTYSKVGGHNILEPAYFGRSVVIGPRVDTQREGFEALSKAKAVTVVENSAELGNSIIDLLEDMKALESQGQRGYSAFLELQGASSSLYARWKEYF